jgi:hypothetical protein
MTVDSLGRTWAEPSISKIVALRFSDFTKMRGSVTIVPDVVWWFLGFGRAENPCVGSANGNRR